MGDHENEDGRERSALESADQRKPSHPEFDHWQERKTSRTQNEWNQEVKDRQQR